MEYGSRLHRFLAFVIDLIVLAVLAGILSAIGIINLTVGGDAEEVSTADGVIQAIIAFGYFFLLTAIFGATLGKMAMGLKVVDSDGNKAGFGPVAIRELIARALGAMLTVVVGAGIGEAVGFAVGVIIVIMVLFDERRQGLHDKVGKTFVVKAR